MLSIGSEIFRILLEFVVFSKASTNILFVLLPSKSFNNYEKEIRNKEKRRNKMRVGPSTL